MPKPEKSGKGAILAERPSKVLATGLAAQNRFCQPGRSGDNSPRVSDLPARNQIFVERFTPTHIEPEPLAKADNPQLPPRSDDVTAFPFQLPDS